MDCESPKTWLDLLPFEACIEVATHVSGNRHVMECLELATTSNIQAKALWHVSRLPILIFMPHLSTETTVDSQAMVIREMEELARIYKDYDFQLLAIDIVQDMPRILGNARIVEWFIPASSDALLDFMISKGEAKMVTLLRFSNENIEQALRRLVVLPLNRVELILKDFNVVGEDLAAACRSLSEECPSLQAIALSGLRFSNSSHWEFIRRLPDCCEISITTHEGLPPKDLLPKLGSLRDVLIRYPFHMNKQKVSDWISEFTSSYQFRVELCVDIDVNGHYNSTYVQNVAKHHQSPAKISLSRPLGEINPLPNVLPLLTREIRISHLSLSIITVPKNEWKSILEQLGNDLVILDIGVCEVFSTDFEESLEHLQVIFWYALLYTNNLKKINYNINVDQKRQEPQHLIRKTYRLARKLQAKMPRLNNGHLTKALDTSCIFED